MKFKKFLESYEAINEAEYNKEWWDSKSDSFKKRYIERHPNSIYAQKAGFFNKMKNGITNFVGKAFGKDRKDVKSTSDNSKTAKPTLSDVQKKYGKDYQKLEDFVSHYDANAFEKAATYYDNKYYDGSGEGLEYFDDEYEIDTMDLIQKIKKKFGFETTKSDLEAILNEVGGKVKLT